jgi:hypothetical protein
MAGPTREDTWAVTLFLNGEDFGIWDTFEGGEVDSEEAKYPPGGMQAEISLGGRRTIGNVTIARLYDWSRDHPRIPDLNTWVGRVRGTIGRQPMDIFGSPRGRPIAYEGTLKTVTPPDIDSTGDSEALLELEFTIDTVA